MKCLIILPNILLSSSKDSKTRQNLIENNCLEGCLEGIIKLSEKVFFPLSGASTSLWLLKKRSQDKVFMFDASNLELNEQEKKLIQQDYENLNNWKTNREKVKSHDYLFLPSIYLYKDEPIENPIELKENIKKLSSELLKAWEEIEKSKFEIKSLFTELAEKGEIT